MRKLITFLIEKLCANFGPLVQLFRLELHVDEVGVLEEARELIQLGLLEQFQLGVE